MYLIKINRKIYLHFSLDFPNIPDKNTQPEANCKQHKTFVYIAHIRGVSDVGFSIFADTDADADFAF